MSRPMLAFACSLLLLCLAGCGDDDAPGPQPEADTPAWSAPAAPAASGSPDGDVGAPRTAASLMRHLLARVRAGHGPSSDREFGRDVDAVAAALWEPDAAGGEARAPQVHVQLANIAGDVATALAAKPPGAPDATELKIHAAWLVALAGTPDAYRAWCAGEGAALLAEREEAVRRMLEGR